MSTPFLIDKCAHARMGHPTVAARVGPLIEAGLVGPVDLPAERE